MTTNDAPQNPELPVCCCCGDQIAAGYYDPESGERTCPGCASGGDD